MYTTVFFGGDTRELVVDTNNGFMKACIMITLELNSYELLIFTFILVS